MNQPNTTDKKIPRYGSDLGNKKGFEWTRPSTTQIREMRRQFGLTMVDACEITKSKLSTWQGWEKGTRPMHPGLWELFQINCQLRRIESECAAN